MSVPTTCRMTTAQTEFFLNGDYSDVNLHLQTMNRTVSEQDQGPDTTGRAKAMRRADSTTAPEAVTALLGPYARTYHLHAITLSSASTHFKALIPIANCQADLDPASPRVLQLVEKVEEGELQAMHDVLRQCYSGDICEPGGSSTQLSVEHLIRMMVLANR